VDPFALIIIVGIVVLAIWVGVLGRFSGNGHHQLDWKSAREITENREALEAEDLAQMVEAANARRRRRGEPEVTVEELELRVMRENAEQSRLREKYLAERELDELLEATNKRRRARGLPERSREDALRELGGSS
jgi:hypothetical protein